MACPFGNGTTKNSIGGKGMYVKSARLTFHIPHAASLKDKRQVCRSLIDKARRRFNVSVAEVGTQDIHQTLTIGISVVSGESAHARNSLDEILRFMESHADAELVEVDADQ
jgi:uncharacterized protein YlxP (DUF503 family)